MTSVRRSDQKFETFPVVSNYINHIRVGTFDHDFMWPGAKCLGVQFLTNVNLAHCRLADYFFMRPFRGAPEHRLAPEA